MLHTTRRLFATGLTAALLAAAALAPPALAQQPASKDPAAVKAGTYKVEPHHTQVVFSLSHFGFNDYYGFFSGASGTLTLDPAKIETAKLDVSVPVDTVFTTSPKLTAELKGGEWFDAARFPTATFASTKVTATGKDTATIEGNLTLHGVTRPVTLEARLVGAGTNPLSKATTVGFEATGTIKRTDFGVSKYAPLVSDEVTLRITAAFELQS